MRYITFLKKIITYDNIPVIITGIYDECYKINYNIESKIKELKFNVYDDIYTVDYKLADCLNKYMDNHVVIAGATVRIQGVNLCTGGILGAVNSNISSSDNDIEEICRDFIMYTNPGGPGVVAHTDEYNKEYINKLFTEYKDNNTVDLSKYVEDLNYYKVDCYIIVTDGCGYGQNGLVIAKDYNSVKTNQLT